MKDEEQPHLGQKVTLKGVDFQVVEINKNRATGGTSVTLEELTPPTAAQRITE